MSTVFKAIDELRIIRGEDAALEFSTILSHYHLNGVNDTSFNREESMVPKVVKKESKGNATNNDSLTQLLDSMTKTKGEEKKQKTTVIKEKEVNDVLLNSIETGKRKRKKVVINEDEDDLFEVKKSEGVKKKKKKTKD